MPILIAALGALAAVYFFVIRARNARDMASEVLDAANDVRLAARRFGFKRQTNVHPVDTIEDPAIALAGLGSAFIELDDLPTREQRDALTIALAKQARISTDDAGELAVLGRWIMNECGSAQQAVPRLARKAYKMQGDTGFTPLMEVVQSVAKAGSGQLNTRQKDALDDVRRAFRIS